MTRAKVAAALFGAVSFISFVAALIPLLKGERMNVVWLGIALVWLIIAVASARNTRPSGGSPPGA